ALPELPAGLTGLDLRGSVDLVSLPSLPVGLDTLDLGGYGLIETLAEPVPQNLEWLHLDRCPRLRRFAPFSHCLTRVRGLDLYGCRFEDLDGSLCGDAKENVAEKVRAHYAALADQGAAALPECKVVVLGNG